MADPIYFPGGGTDKISDWYTGAMDPSAAAGMSTANSGGGLTTRLVKTVKIDPATGAPVNPWTQMVQSYGNSVQAKSGNFGRGLPIDYQEQYNNWTVDNSLRDAKTTLLAFDKSGKPLDPPGLGYANPIAGTPVLPVANMTPEIASAYAAVEAGQPGATQNLATLLADAVSSGNIGKSPVYGAGIKIGTPTPAPAPTTIKGSSTGKSYKVGQTYQTSPTSYSFVAQPDGSFKNTGYSAETQAAREQMGKEIGAANRKSASPTHDVMGNNNAFNTKNQQNSLRWQTGY